MYSPLTQELTLGGIPWWAILDADGKVLATSNLPTGENIGYPSDRDGQQQFQRMLEQTAQRMTAEQIAALVNTLKE